MSWGKDPWEAAFDLLLDKGLKCRQVSISYKSHHEEDVRIVLKNPVSMPITDASAFPSNISLIESNAQPRAFGTFPLVFRKYVRGETRSDLPEEVGSKILTLEDAVRRMTSLPAQVLGLQNRGILREGSKADIVIFDSEKITDKATYLKAHQYPEGIPYVIVNGTLVIDNGAHTGALPGEILYGPGHRP